MSKILVLAGDGIGPEVMNEAMGVLRFVSEQEGIALEFEESLVGGCAYEDGGKPLSEDTLKLAKEADAVLLGAVGGPKWEGLDFSVRPERALLALRKELDLFANLRPARVYPALVEASTLKPEVVSGVDLMVLRELTGGIYFGEPRGVSGEGDARRGVNTLVYTVPEIERIVRLAFEIAKGRNKKVTSVDKANVLEVTELWRETAEQVAKDFSEVSLNHLYVDNAAMQLIRDPKQFDVLVTGNLFGDILSDEAAMLTGSIGMLPSASLAASKKGMFEPVHGSAPDIAGKGVANPLATILSAAMLLDLTLGHAGAARKIEEAVEQVLEDGIRPADLAKPGDKTSSTSEVGEQVLEKLKGLYS